MIFFLPLPDRDKDFRFHLSHFQKSGYVCRLLSQCFDFFFLKYFSHFFVHESCQSICRVYLVYQDRVLRLMSHCFFPLKRIAFYCTQIIVKPFQCALRVFPAVNTITAAIFLNQFSHNSADTFPKSFFFLGANRNTADKFIVVRTSSQCPVSIGRFAFLCAMNIFPEFITGNS